MSQTRYAQRLAQGNNAIMRGKTSGGYIFCTPLHTKKAKGNMERPALINKISTTSSFTCSRLLDSVFDASKVHTSRRNRRVQYPLKIKGKTSTLTTFIETPNINAVRSKKNK
jgi:predicted RNA-binding protein with PIN domain